MNNNAKLSKVMLIAGALVFASFYSFSAKAVLPYEQDPSFEGSASAGANNSAEQDSKVAQANSAAQKMSDLQAAQYENQKAYSAAQKAYVEAVGAKQQEVQRQKAICQADPNNCQGYIDAQKSLEETKKTEQAKVDAARETVNNTSKEIKKQSRATENAVYKAQKEANSELKSANKAMDKATDKLNDANADIAKYCSGDKYNAKKCQKAQTSQKEAQAEIAIASKNAQAANNKLNEANSAAAKATGQDALTQKALAERDAQVEANNAQINNLNQQISALDPNDPSYARKKSELEAQKKELENYNKGVEQAKIKEGLITPEQKSSADLAKDMAQSQNEYSAAKDAYTQAAADLAKVNAECAKGKPDACAQKKAKEQALEYARAAADEAYRKKVGAEKAASNVSETDKATAEMTVAANKKLEEAKKAEEKACANPNSEECNTAKQAREAAENAVKDPIGAAEKTLEEAKKAEEKACANPNSTECGEAKKATAEAQQAMAPLLAAKSSDAQSKLDDAKAETEAKTKQLNDLKAQLDEARQACEYSSKLTSKAGQADAEKYCAQAAQLEQAVTAAEQELVNAEIAQAAAEAEANALGGENLDHTGQVYQAFSTAKEDLYSGRYIGGGEFGNTSDVFQTLTRRAMRILVGLKPIVYTFAGFGLIGFAFMAIFNKISWKWFSNIAIGLFLVANMGRFIEYFVYPDINGEVQAQKLSFGNYLRVGYADTEYVWVDEISAYMPPQVIGEEEIPDVGINVPEAETNARGFCQAEKKGGGLFGGGGFMSCVKDLVAAGKKAVDTVKKVQDTVDTVKSTVDQVKAAATNIGDAAKMIGKGNLEDTFTALGKIGQNVNAMVGASGGMVNGIMSNVSDISNNVQDMTKSRDEVAELEEKRARGEATNKLDAALKGQKIDADGNVERLWGGLDKDGNQKEGAIAGNSNFLTGLQDTTNNIVEKSRELNGQYQDAMTTAGGLASGVGNFSAFGSKSINQKLQEKRTQKQQAANKAAAEKAAAESAAQKKAQQELEAGREAAAQADTSVSSQQSYNSAVQNAQSAEQTARNKESTAANAQKDATAKQETADKLNEAAQAAKELAEKTGTAEDKRAAELAAQRANIAQAQADAAKEKAESSKKAAEEAREQANAAKGKADSLRGDAVDEGINKAKETQENASKTIEDADKIIEENKANLDSQQEAVDKADAALQEAIKKAQESGSDEDYREVGRLQNEKKQAEKELKETQQTIAEQEAAKAAAEREAAEARIKQAQLEAEKNHGLTQDKIDQMERDDEKAERLRQQYAKDNTATAQAQAAETKAGEAQTAAQNAQIAAENKELAAQRAAQAAAEAQKKAAESGTPEDKKAAELAQKRAELAANEAEAAKEKAKELEEEAKELTDASTQASLNEAKYLQGYYEQDVADAEVAIVMARNSVSAAQNEVNAAQEEANRALEEAKKRNDTASILAAKAAADKLAQKQAALREAQKELENQIKRRNSSQKAYYEAQERQSELERGL